MLYEIDGQPAFRIALYDHPVAKKWRKLIQSIYVGDGNDIDHYRTFFSLRGRKDLHQILVDAVENINNFMKCEYIKIPKNVEWTEQEVYNELHMKFEKLSGTHDNPTKLFMIAPMHVKESIRDLNYAVHTMEHNKSTMQEPEDLNIQWTKKRERTPRLKLTKEEYELITFQKKEHEVYLAYNELGKSFNALWQDNLPADYKHGRNNHYIGADIIVSFSDKQDIFVPNFIKWCKENQIDPYEKSLGIGLLPIGKIKNYQKLY
jgi:hypothetical protein